MKMKAGLLQRTVKFGEQLCVVGHLGGVWQGLTTLKVSFSIKLSSFDITKAIRLRRRQQQEVSCHKLVILHKDQVAYLNLQLMIDYCHYQGLRLRCTIN